MVTDAELQQKKVIALQAQQVFQTKQQTQRLAQINRQSYTPQQFGLINKEFFDAQKDWFEKDFDYRSSLNALELERAQARLDELKAQEEALAQAEQATEEVIQVPTQGENQP